MEMYAIISLLVFSVCIAWLLGCKKGQDSTLKRFGILTGKDARNFEKNMRRNERTAEQREHQTIDGIHAFTTEQEKEERREALKELEL